MSEFDFLRVFFAKKKILVVVSASVAIYKSLDIISTLHKLGAKIRVVMSNESVKLINPLLFEALSKKAVLHTDSQSWSKKNAPNHITYAKWAQIVLIAPATANTIAKFAQGIADDISICTLLACNAKKILTPAMNTTMLNAPQTQANLSTLRSLGVEIIEPKNALLACGDVGKGALADKSEIIFALLRSVANLKHARNVVLNDSGFEREIIMSHIDCSLAFWRDKEVVITGGGSSESIDSVRVMSNLSSGKQAYFLALCFYTLGAKVTLITSKLQNDLPPLPHSIKQVQVSTSKEFYNAILESRRKCKNIPYLFMSAAIADFMPKSPAKHKIKKEQMQNLTLELTRNMDILESLDSKEFIKIGFKAESDKKTALKSAQAMLERKQCLCVCLNIINAQNKAFGEMTNTMQFIWQDSTKVLNYPISKFALSFEIANIVRVAKENALDSSQVNHSKEHKGLKNKHNEKH